MKRFFKISFGLLLPLLLTAGLFFGCRARQPDASMSVVVGRADELFGGSPEWPSAESTFVFSDVSALLAPESQNKSSASSRFSSAKTSGKTSSAAKTSGTTSSIATTSGKASSSGKTSSANFSGTVSEEKVTSVPGNRVHYSTVKAVWISYIDYADILTGKTESEFRSRFETVCKNAKNFGLNTLVCQVRAFGDAVYPSGLFPWSQMAAGIGKAPGYDPLAVMLEIAHRHNLSFHAWVNPFRTFLDSQLAAVPSGSVFMNWYRDGEKNGRYIVKNNDRWYYNPGEPEVRQLILNGVIEIIKNYAVDGIHFDDYFYPTQEASFDQQSYRAYGGGKSLAQFRRQSVSSLVKSVYQAVKQTNPNIWFGISPQANIQNDMDQQYADVKLWATSNGYVDYLCPQIYYSYRSETLAFTDTLNSWKKLVTASQVRLMTGLAVFRVGCRYDTWACPSSLRPSHLNNVNCGAYGWQSSTPGSSDILARQYRDSLAVQKCAGVFLYSYQYLFRSTELFRDKTAYADNAVTQAKSEINKLKTALSGQ